MEDQIFFWNYGERVVIEWNGERWIQSTAGDSFVGKWTEEPMSEQGRKALCQHFGIAFERLQGDNDALGRLSPQRLNAYGRTLRVA